MTMIDTPDGIAFVKACARRGALALEIKGMTRSKGRQTAYSIVKEVYGFRGNRESVLADLTEYIDAEQRLRELPEGVGIEVTKHTQELIDRLTSDEQLSQQEFERLIFIAEQRGAISHDFRQAMSDLFYVAIVRQNAGRK